MHLNLMAPMFPQLDVNIPEGWWKQDAQLDLDFANKRAYNKFTQFRGRPDSILTYTSPSPKMVYGADGVLRYAPHNLLAYSSSVENWTAIGGATLIANQSADSTGAVTLCRVLNNTADNQQNCHAQRLAGVTIGAGMVLTLSVELRSSNDRFAYRVYRNGGTDWRYVRAVASTGVATVVAAANITLVSESVTDLGGGLYRHTLSVVATTGGSYYIEYGPSDGGAGSGQPTSDIGQYVDIGRVQLNLGSSALTYIPTTTAVVYSLPIDHNPTTFAPLGVLIEEQRTNLLTYSEQFDNAAWAKGGYVTVTTNAVTAPDGTTTADKVVETASTSTHNISQTSTIVTATVYTQSVYAKAAERSWVCLEGGGGAGSYSVWFNLSTGTVGTINNTAAGNVSIVALPNGWYRCIVTDTSTSTSGTYRHYICDADNNQSYTGDGTSGLYLWGAQLEAGAFATSYIPTVASQVTRAADQVTLATSAFGYNAAESTLLQEALVPNNNGVLSNLLSTTANILYTYRLNSTSLYLYGLTGGAFMVGIAAGGAPAASFNKVAWAAKLNDFAIVSNGGAVSSDTLGAMPAAATTLQIGGYDAASNNKLNGHIKRLTYFPTRKTNAELQGLTI